MPHVEDQKAEAGSSKGERLEPEAMFADPEADDGQPEECGSTRRPCQSVHAVTHIDRIDEADNESKRDNQEKRSGQDLYKHFRSGRGGSFDAVGSKPEIGLRHPGDSNYQEGCEQLDCKARRDRQVETVIENTGDEDEHKPWQQGHGIGMS